MEGATYESDQNSEGFADQIPLDEDDSAAVCQDTRTASENSSCSYPAKKVCTRKAAGRHVRELS